MIENLSRSQLLVLIDEWIVGKNGERNRAILKRRLIDGKTYEQIAEEFDLSVRQTKTIIYKEMQKLIRHI